MTAGRLLALALALAGCRAPPAILPLRFHSTLERAAGGLTIATEVDRSVRAVAIVSVVKAGAAQDPPGQEGLAHLVEHLAHRWRAADGINWRTQMTAMGADWQGSTYSGQTVYFVMVPNFAASEALDREAARLADPLAGVDEAAFERERRLVADEHRLRQNRSGSSLFIACLAASLYPGVPEYALRDESEESLQQLTLDEARRFVDRHYRPSRTTVLLAGDLPADAAARFGRSYQQAEAALPQAPQAPLLPSVPPVQQTCRVFATSQPQVWVAWAVPPTDAGTVGVQVLAKAWASSKLRGLVDMRHEEIQSVQVALLPGRAGGVLVARAMLSRQTAGPWVAELIIRQINDLWGQRPGHVPPVQLRPMLALWHAMDFEDLETRSLATALWMVRTGGGPGDLLRAHEQAFGAVGDDDLQRFVDRHLKANQATIWQPEIAGKATPFTARVVESLIPGKDDVAWTQVARAPAAPAPWRRVEVAASGAPAGLQRFPYPTAQRRLNNGLTVLAVQRPGTKTTTATIGFRGGHASAPPGVALAAQIASRPALHTSGLDSSLTMDATTTTVSAHALSGDGARALGWLADEVSIHANTLFTLGPQWPPDDLQARVIPRLTSLEKQAETRLSHAFQAAVFEGHSYGKPHLGWQLNRVSSQLLGDWLEALRQPGNALLVVTSTDEPRLTLDRAAAAFGGWRSLRISLPAPQPLPPLRAADLPVPEREPILVSEPASPHARLSLGCRLPATSLREAARAHLLAELLDADFWNEVREAHGHSYGFTVDETTERDTTVVALEAETPVAVLTETLAKLRQRWRQWAEQGFDPDQLQVVRSGAVAATMLEGGSSADLAWQLARWWARGRSLEEHDQWATTLASLSADELRATAALCRANLVLALAADRGLAEAAVKAGWKD